MKLFRFFFFLLSFYSFCFANLPNTVQLASDLTLNWGFSNDGTNIIINLQVYRHSWVGIGLHALGSSEIGMHVADYSIASFDKNGILQMDDRYSNPAGGKPLYDYELGGYNNILEASAFQTDGYTSVTYMRNLVTNDTVADHPFVNGLVNVIWAYGDLSTPNPNFFDYHGPTNRGSIMIDFFTDQTSVDTLPPWHGALMYLSYGVLMTFGVFVSRYLKAYYWWFPLHIIVQVTAIIVALIGFIIAIKMTNRHFSNVHSWFGFVTLCLTAFSPFVGWAADLVYNPSRTHAPIWPDLIHRWSGRLTVLFSYVTIILGMKLYELPISTQLLFGLLEAYFILLYIYLEVYRKINSKELVDH